MKVGAEQKGKLILLIGLLVAGGIAWMLNGGIGGSFTQSVFSSGDAQLPDLSHLDPSLHLAGLERLRAITYHGGGRDLFHVGAPPPPPPAHPAVVTVTPPAVRGAAPGAPGSAAGGPAAPPPMPLKFYGSTNPTGGGNLQVWVMLGDKINIVSQGDTIEGRYRIEKVTRLSVHVRDIQTNQEQDLPLYQGQ